jgi:ssDNA-binding replication factor A large subunit
LNTYNHTRLSIGNVQTVVLEKLENPRKRRVLDFDVIDAAGGTVIAKEENRTRRVDKGKSGQAQKTAVSGGFGGGILSQD